MIDTMMSNTHLTRLQQAFFWMGFLGPIPSIVLYVFFTEGTIENFGGTVSPTSLFWCSIAASGDAIFSAMSYAVLKHPKNVELRQSVLWAMAVYSIFHFGGFIRAHYTQEPHPGGPVGYIFAIIITWAAYFSWGSYSWVGPGHGGEKQQHLENEQRAKELGYFTTG